MTNTRITAIIFYCGSGTRLRPLSRKPMDSRLNALGWEATP
ncbi:MAG: hypothetical protein Q7T10_15875 [Rhodoferax sp.]|nr:hypothetical protein [Rhodoferax sp.]MDO8450276.1 hypothetical protein [Rhodoferax sp.]